MEREVLSVHLCPRCKTPIHAVVLTTHPKDLSLWCAWQICEETPPADHREDNLRIPYRMWPVANAAGVAAVTLLSKHHLSDWSLSEKAGKCYDYAKKKSAAAHCPVLAFFSPSPIKQIEKLFNWCHVGQTPKPEVFSLLVQERPHHLQVVPDKCRQFHPLFALNLNHADQVSDFQFHCQTRSWPS